MGNFHSVCSAVSVLWKLRKFTLTIFDKNFVKAKLLLKNRFHDISRFSENFLQCILKYSIHTETSVKPLSKINQFHAKLTHLIKTKVVL